MTRALLERCQRELLDVLASCNRNAVHHDGDDFHELLANIRAHLAQPQAEPAWHDAPTVPGLWFVGSRCLHINELDLPIYKDSRCRWYGPISDDVGGKP